MSKCKNCDDHQSESDPLAGYMKQPLDADLIHGPNCVKCCAAAEKEKLDIIDYLTRMAGYSMGQVRKNESRDRQLHALAQNAALVSMVHDIRDGLHKEEQ